MTKKDSTESLDTSAAAAYLGCSIALMELMRREDRGPKFYKCGKRLVRYRRADLEEWMQANVVTRKTTGEVPAQREAGL
jgi:predicted DNA-binding transcriptional regulator AlpA